MFFLRIFFLIFVFLTDFLEGSTKERKGKSIKNDDSILHFQSCNGFSTYIYELYSSVECRLQQTGCLGLACLIMCRLHWPSRISLVSVSEADDYSGDPLYHLNSFLKRQVSFAVLCCFWGSKKYIGFAGPTLGCI